MQALSTPAPSIAEALGSLSAIQSVIASFSGERRRTNTKSTRPNSPARQKRSAPHAARATPIVEPASPVLNDVAMCIVAAFKTALQTLVTIASNFDGNPREARLAATALLRVKMPDLPQTHPGTLAPAEPATEPCTPPPVDRPTERAIHTPDSPASDEQDPGSPHDRQSSCAAPAQLAGRPDPPNARGAPPRPESHLPPIHAPPDPRSGAPPTPVAQEARPPVR